MCPQKVMFSVVLVMMMLLRQTVVGLAPSEKKLLERRNLLGSVGVAVVGSSIPAPSYGMFDISEILEKRADIPRIPRQDLNQKFAVLLMRTSYNVVDDLDFIAMDEFQKDFFLRRQNEWEKYVIKSKQRLGRPPMQGDLTDAAYFDFISFAQYETINAALVKPKSVFNELLTAEGDSVVIARGGPDSIPDNLLALTHSQRVGNAILDYILDTYKDVDINGPLLPNIQQLFQWFAINGFAADAQVSLSTPVSTSLSASSTLDIRLLAPANLWSLQNLLKSKRQLTNDFVAKTLTAYLTRRDGCAFTLHPQPTFVDGATSTLHRCQVLTV
uniref:Uncharacterized protein n=1 Tax=Aureoumbra lagunensis TaxID=44058 RepID=A0A7S3K3I2_9STRA|mmetsp:Transcript_1552/g.2325  ORF Transcript_1552/g.2325 Transcript_1552/m.2325 type:complete len:328 (+) Transcript_1552:25-1008(+)